MTTDTIILLKKYVTFYNESGKVVTLDELLPEYNKYCNKNFSDYPSMLLSIDNILIAEGAPLEEIENAINQLWAGNACLYHGQLGDCDNSEPIVLIAFSIGGAEDFLREEGIYDEAEITSWINTKEQAEYYMKIYNRIVLQER